MIDFVSFIPTAVMQGMPLLFGSTGETLTEKSGNLNLGIPGIMYVGAISGVIGAFLYEQSVPSPEAMNGFLAIVIPLCASLLGSLLMGLIYCFLTVTLRANQNVTGLALTTFGVGIGNFFGGSLIKLAGSGRAVDRPCRPPAVISPVPCLRRPPGRLRQALPILRLSGLPGGHAVALGPPGISCGTRALASICAPWAKTR